MSPELSKCTINRVAESRLPCQPIGKDFYPGRANLPLSWGFTDEIVVVALVCCRPKKPAWLLTDGDLRYAGLRWNDSPPFALFHLRRWVPHKPPGRFYFLCALCELSCLSPSCIHPTNNQTTVESHCPFTVPLRVCGRVSVCQQTVWGDHLFTDPGYTVAWDSITIK